MGTKGLEGRELLDEEAFLAQLSLRARLLDLQFQSRVLGVVLWHAISPCDGSLKGDAMEGFNEAAGDNGTGHCKVDELRQHHRMRSSIRSLNSQAPNEGELIPAGAADSECGVLAGEIWKASGTAPCAQVASVG